jgi:hypothetical protein
VGQESAASAGQLAQAIEKYLADHPAAALLEDGRVVFEMRSARYSVGAHPQLATPRGEIISACLSACYPAISST